MKAKKYWTDDKLPNESYISTENGYPKSEIPVLVLPLDEKSVEELRVKIENTLYKGDGQAGIINSYEDSFKILAAIGLTASKRKGRKA